MPEPVLQEVISHYSKDPKLAELGTGNINALLEGASGASQSLKSADNEKELYDIFFVQCLIAKLISEPEKEFHGIKFATMGFVFEQKGEPISPVNDENLDQVFAAISLAEEKEKTKFDLEE